MGISIIMIVVLANTILRSMAVGLSIITNTS